MERFSTDNIHHRTPVQIIKFFCVRHDEVSGPERVSDCSRLGNTPILTTPRNRRQRRDQTRHRLSALPDMVPRPRRYERGSAGALGSLSSQRELRQQFQRRAGDAPDRRV
jgi:hypothetical protein